MPDLNVRTFGALGKVRVHDVVTIETTGLGDRSYLAHDGEVGVVIDPQRDTDQIITLAERAVATPGHTFTLTRNDGQSKETMR